MKLKNINLPLLLLLAGASYWAYKKYLDSKRPITGTTESLLSSGTSTGLTSLV